MNNLVTAVYISEKLSINKKEFLIKHCQDSSVPFIEISPELQLKNPILKLAYEVGVSAIIKDPFRSFLF